MKSLNNYSKEILRIGIASVYLWFGISQYIDPTAWTGWLPAWIYSLPLDATDFIYLNGGIEILFATLLLVGYKTRFSAMILVFHMILILFHVGYNDIFVRDFGILIATCVIFLNGTDTLTLDTKIKNKIGKK